MANKEFVTFAKLITQKYSPEEAAKMTSIERHPDVYLTHLAERTKLRGFPRQATSLLVES